MLTAFFVWLRYQLAEYRAYDRRLLAELELLTLPGGAR